MEQCKVCYGVYIGKQPGVYLDKKLAEEQVVGYPNGKWRKFTTVQAAKEYSLTGKIEQGEKRSEKPIEPYETIVIDSPFVPNPELEPFMIFVDGSFKQEDGKTYAGCGIHFPENPSRDFKKKFPLHTPTQNRTELYAAIEALRMIEDEKVWQPQIPRDRLVVLATDSQYVFQAICQYYEQHERKQWKKVKNSHLIQELKKGLMKRATALQWVPSHSGIEGNDMADLLAAEAALSEETQA